MGLHSPPFAGSQGSVSERGESEFVFSGGDVFGNLLQGLEVGDVGNFIAGLFEESLVDDDAVGLGHISNAADGAVGALQSKGVVGEFLGDSGIGEIRAVFFPGFKTDRTVDLEQGGSIRLGDFRSQSLFVLAVGSGGDINLNAGFLGVLLGQFLPLCIRFGLEVQIVHVAFLIAAAAIAAAAGFAGRETGYCGSNQHSRRKDES